MSVIIINRDDLDLARRGIYPSNSFIAFDTGTGRVMDAAPAPSVSIARPALGSTVLLGSASPGTLVQIFKGTAVLGNAVSDDSGSWRLSGIPAVSAGDVYRAIAASATAAAVLVGDDGSSGGTTTSDPLTPGLIPAIA